MIQFKSKANTLLSLKNKIKHATILPMYIFTTKEWLKDKEGVYNSIIKESWFSWPVIVRSSHSKEDSQLESLAGHYESILNVANKKQLFLSIEKVLRSYKNKITNNQIFVQPMLKNVIISGVILSHDINSSAPYFSINYDDTSKDTTSITSGKRINKNYFFHHSGNGKVPKKLEKVVLMVKELFKMAGSTPIDIEFAIDSSNKCYLLQIRKLVISEKSKYPIDVHTNIINDIENKLKKFKKKHPYLLGDKTFFGVMSDWNPAEMIGIRPRPLSLSLYQNLITDSTWAYQRDNYGYRKLRGIPLMQSFSGIPFIDLRVSFNSFIPKSLDKKIAEKLVNYYLDELSKKPHLHDKIEFEIAFTCFTFTTSKRMNKLLDYNFNKIEVRKIKNSLIALTNNIINYKTGIWRTDLDKIKELTTRRKKIDESSLSAEEKVFFLLEDCRRYGTLPFAGLARVGFISIEFLNSLEDMNIITDIDKQNFLLSLQTITTSLSNDIVKMNKKIFLEKYGHLRPGTYDIRSKRYDENYSSYFRYHTKSNKSITKNRFKLAENQVKKIKMILNQNKIDYDVKYFFKFLKEGIESREFAKFEFTKNVSLILKLITKLGKKYGFSRDDCSFIDIKIIDKLMNSNKDVKTLLHESIETGRKDFSKTEGLNLPGLILKKMIYGPSLNFVLSQTLLPKKR